ncbi:hypothetical protein FNV43_RR12760 [Rhamnella rubrinervis]|uniref:Galactose-binding domain-containing protein n=1 Tax=Rhamnella rubrinervis TaxID=2594499 RepID=A0A8K0H8K0_9ROSA|nr:hypothetical protein FNV43_RR12760 [Rhamnella rubrinervis]
MEIELEERVKPLAYKVKAMSRESPSQKAAHVLDADLRTHWSTATNTKEWILLELNEPCLLSHIRIYNKSVLEWEISVGLRFKPETFVKVRPRCEAPRRDMMYPTNYTPCRYVRISCLRGNPIAIFFVQLIGVSVVGLEPEFQPVVNHLLPHIISHKQDVHDMHLQLLKDMTNRLLVFLPQLETDLNSFSDAVEPNLRFLAMLAGPFYPILHVVNERATTKSSGNICDTEVSKNCQQSSALTVSSNFEPRRSRSSSPFLLLTSSSVVFRQDLIFMLLRKAYKDSDLGTVCRMASRILQKLIEPVTVQEASVCSSEVTSGDESSKSELFNPPSLVDYSNMFGEEFKLPDDQCDSNYLNILDLAAVEEGILHVLYACGSQPTLCSKFAGRTSDFWSALPLVQALLPALRPSVVSPDIVDDSFSQWKQPVVQQALSQIVATSSSSLYRPLLHACAGYLASFSPSHAKAACVLIDLCCGVLAPWMTQVIAKVDLTVELLEDLLGTVQTARHSLPHARAALKYILLAISGHMDDILGKYKEVKQRILFLVEMLEPFLDPAIASFKSTIAFGDLSSAYPERQESNCVFAFNVIRTAVRKPEVLPSLESEWRRGSVAPSVLLSILEPHMQLPPEVDLRISAISKSSELDSTGLSSGSRGGVASSKSNNQDELDGKLDLVETAAKMDIFYDATLLFAPIELRSIALTSISNDTNESSFVSTHGGVSSEPKLDLEKIFLNQFHIDLELDASFTAEYFNLQADYFQLINYQDCELKASEFRHLALDLHSQNEIVVEGHDAAIDALLLAAECYVNPFFMMSFKISPKFRNQMNFSEIRTPKSCKSLELRRVSGKYKSDLEKIAFLEKKRDKIVLQILLEAAELDRKYKEKVSGVECCSYSGGEFDENAVKLSPLDIHSTDAITLVRQNQALLCNFLTQRLQREQHSMHEILIQSLVFLLHSATKLYCAPELVIDIILRSAEYLNGMLSSLYHQFKEGLELTPETVYGIQRRWILLQRLVIASSNGDEGADFAINKNNGFRYQNLIPPSAWMHRISTFSRSTFPLVRFLGWMAVSRNAKQYIKDRLFLASDLQQLTYLLSIFGDELAVVDNVTNKKHEGVKFEELGAKHVFLVSKGSEVDSQQHENQSFHVIYPDLSKFFPNMKMQFEAFGEIVLEAVGLQLRSLSSSVVPDMLCWFSELCSWPFYPMDQIATQNGSDNVKGYAAKNAKAIILYVLEAIITEHMEAMVPEIPRVVQVLVSLCRTSYCDVLFLDSVMQLLEPIISYSLCKVSDEERLLPDDSCVNFESLCFGELFINIRSDENHDGSTVKVYSRGLTIFILASIFPYLSVERRREMLHSLRLWADFTAFEPTTTFHDYLCAFQNVIRSCKLLLVQNLQLFGAIPLQLSTSRECGSTLESHSWFLGDVFHDLARDNFSEKLEGSSVASVIVNQKAHHLSTEEIEEFSKDLEVLIAKLNPTVELCWNLHHQLAKKLTISSAECHVYSKCLLSVAQKSDYDDGNQTSCTSKSDDQSLVHWRIALEGISETILALQEKSCWEVASVILDCLLGVPHCFGLDNVIGFICSAIKINFCSAPKIAWRLQTDKWLSVLLARGIHSISGSEAPLVDLFCIMLGHPEPELRFIALKFLGKLVGQDLNGGTALQDSVLCNNLFTPSSVLSIPESVISHLVSSTWDHVVLLASSDKSLLLRTRAMELLVYYIPFTQRHLLQSLLATADNIYGLGKLSQPTCEGPLLRLSLALIAGACLYCPSEDISLIPQNVWRNIETVGLSKSENRLGDIEKKACQILCRLKNEGDEAKEVLKEVLYASSSKQFNPDFGSTREAVLQVLVSLTSVRSYFDIFSNKVDKEAMELEEAEMELNILQKEDTTFKESKEECQIPSLESVKDETRLQQIKECINSLEKSKLREDIAARRQRKLLMRHARKKYLEEVAVREAELLQELDRERAAETEKEIERQRLLELERAKTRELRHNLEMEKERQTQRELQRELEQAESGRPLRREFSSSTHSSRTRERYRERENGRLVAEGSTRTSSGNSQPETSTASSSMATMPTVVLSGSRPFSGQLPTILQSRDRLDECGSSYEENLDGSKDSGDTGSVGDPDLASAFDGQPGGFGSAQRHGSRGSKSRQVVERRERDGRREGKWERKGMLAADRSEKVLGYQY